jgi:hypothetical protein
MLACLKQSKFNKGFLVKKEKTGLKKVPKWSLKGPVTVLKRDLLPEIGDNQKTGRRQKIYGPVPMSLD